ncbi:Hypp4620 [Branchiostoma lanceolatum]|uniref:Hypp4620 protein n=1 Tax=Branchiostoma lanceolatum TaxID=7740 RepID=A0A8K0AEL9_BRALA|nr:Hypp4620 [Branchiostoma lanceolatum]
MKPVMTGESGRLQWDKAPKTAVESHAEGKLAACLDLGNSEDYKPLYVLSKAGVPTGVRLASLLESPGEEAQLTDNLNAQETETEVFNLEVKSSASWWGRMRSKFKTNSSRPKDSSNREQGVYLVMKNSRVESLEEETLRKYLTGKTVHVESAGVHDLNGEFLVVSVAWTAEDVRAVVKTQEPASSDEKNDDSSDIPATETEQVIETYSTSPCTVAYSCVVVKYNKDTGLILASGSPRGTHKTKKEAPDPKESSTSPTKSSRSFRDRFKRRGSSISVEWSEDLEKKGTGGKLRSSGSWVDESELETIEG